MQKQCKFTVLVVGGGGREHALCRKIRQSPNVAQIYCAPGNAGISQVAECVPIKADNIKALIIFARVNKVDLTVVGPEGPLCAGIVDEFQAAGLTIFGPSKDAARLEGSKIFAKEIMGKYGVPTAKWEACFDAGSAMQALAESWREEGPQVIKYDLLAAGKGVFVPGTKEAAMVALDEILNQKAFGEGGCIIEKRLNGFEVSVLAFVDGETVRLLPSSQDHKRVGEGDTGENTGGMGAYSPVPTFTPEMEAKVLEKIMKPIAKAMVEEGHPYRGILYAGIMVVDSEIFVLEFNVRLGDPEAQPVLMRLKTDVVEIMLAVCDGRLADFPPLDIDPRPAVCVVMASSGYPGGYEKGFPIIGLAEAEKIPGVFIFHAGTAEKDGNFVTAGGRVLGVTAMGNDLLIAISRAYAAVGMIKWHGAFVRSDIAHRAL